jgi:hypothetical protein
MDEQREPGDIGPDTEAEGRGGFTEESPEPLRIDLIEHRFEYLSGKAGEGRESSPTLPSCPNEEGGC